MIPVTIYLEVAIAVEAGIQDRTGFRIEPGMILYGFDLRSNSNRQEANPSSAISIIERSPLLMAFAAASTSGRTCLMK